MSQPCKATVLVVDDEPMLSMDLADMLQRGGCCTLEASNADEALELLVYHPAITAVFTDIRMPGTLDGLELAHVIKRRWPHIAVVVCSGNRRPAQTEMPADTIFLAKPIVIPFLNKVMDGVGHSLRP